jgi:hypothetical protein
MTPQFPPPFLILDRQNEHQEPALAGVVMRKNMAHTLKQVWTG